MSSDFAVKSYETQPCTAY